MKSIWAVGGRSVEGNGGRRPAGWVSCQWAWRAVLLCGLLAMGPAVRGQFVCQLNGDGLTITGYTGGGGTVVIPDRINGLRVTAIGPEAFGGCHCLTNLVVGNQVTSLGEGAFMNCTGLVTATLDRRLDSIGEQAFAGCRQLTGIVLPPSVTTVGTGAFARCANLTSIAVQHESFGVGIQPHGGDRRRWRQAEGGRRMTVLAMAFFREL